MLCQDPRDAFESEEATPLLPPSPLTCLPLYPPSTPWLRAERKNQLLLVKEMATPFDWYSMEKSSMGWRENIARYISANHWTI